MKLRARKPELDDEHLLQIIKTRLVPYAQMARPNVVFNRRDVLRRWKECRVVVLAEPGRSPAGFISYRIEGGTVYIDMLGLQKRYEGRGFGSALIREAEQAGRREGAYTAQLAVDEPNSHARSFYTRKGYQPAAYYPDQGMIVLFKYLGA